MRHSVFPLLYALTLLKANICKIHSREESQRLSYPHAKQDRYQILINYIKELKNEDRKWRKKKLIVHLLVLISK